MAEVGGPRGTSPPLDLRAVEARLLAGIPKPYANPKFQQWADVTALLAHARALRAAARQVVTLHDNYRASEPTLVEFTLAIRALAVVLAAAVDTEP